MTLSKPHQLRVCYFGTYESSYPRNRMFINGLRMNNVIIHECHEPFWELFEEKGSEFRLGFGTILKFVAAQFRLAWRYTTKMPDHDIIMVGFIGQIDMFLAKTLAWLTGRKLVFNPLVSIYDTVVGDRKMVTDASLKARFFKWLDQISCRMSDLVFLDTEAHIDYFCQAFNLERAKFQRIWVGADESVFCKPTAALAKENPTVFEILFIGKFIPLHGLPKIIETAKLLEHEEKIHFTLVGHGQLRQVIEAQIQTLDLKNITMINWIPYESLGEIMTAAAVILGIFGDSDKAARVIPNKVYQALAVGKPVLTMDSVAARELLTHRKNAFLVTNSAEAMAAALLELKADNALLKTLEGNAQEIFDSELNNSALGLDIRRALEVLVGN